MGRRDGMTVDRTMDGERYDGRYHDACGLTAHGMADEGMTDRPYGRRTV